MVAGTYLIINKKTGQKYVGGSVDIDYRMYLHEHSPNDCSYIDNAIQKYGFDNFEWIILEELPKDWDIIGEREKYWIEFYNTFKNKKHYNLTEGGGGISGYRKKHDDFEYTVAKKGFVDGKQRYCIYNRNNRALKTCADHKKLEIICDTLNSNKITEYDVKSTRGVNKIIEMIK